MSGERVMPVDEDRRRDALMAFLGAGLHGPPSRTQAVAALADARRMAASHQARRESIGEWLTSEIRLHGIRENAAILAVMEVHEYRRQAAQIYARHHPDRLQALNDMLAALT